MFGDTAKAEQSNDRPKLRASINNALVFPQRAPREPWIFRAALAALRSTLPTTAATWRYSRSRNGDAFCCARRARLRFASLTMLRRQGAACCVKPSVFHLRRTADGSGAHVVLWPAKCVSTIAQAASRGVGVCGIHHFSWRRLRGRP